MVIRILFFCLLLSQICSAQSFSKYIGGSQRELVRSRGLPEISKPNGDGYIYLYSGDEAGERITYGIKDGKVYMAIQSFTGLSLSGARNKRDIMILFYMTAGYKKQGTQAGMTILKKGDKVLSAGYMDDTGGSYVTLITAYN